MTALSIVVVYIALLAVCATVATTLGRWHLRWVLTAQERAELIAQQAQAEREAIRAEVERLLAGDPWEPTVLRPHGEEAAS